MANKRWTDEEELLLRTYVAESVEAGDSIANAFRKMRRKTGRTFLAYSVRWQTINAIEKQSSSLGGTGPWHGRFL